MGTNLAQHAPLPKNYRLIYDIVQESGLGRHLRMSDIFARAAGLRPGIGYSTIYRGLIRLRELGLIAEIVVPGADAATYEPVGPSHAHVRCVACGAIEDVAYALPPRVLKNVAFETGFSIDSGNVTFTGLCAGCSPAQRR
ncbi:MAG: transcriptional repressor [Candidatus Eremiobacteraeota bacterium]|nr:transcriptional repressor [Candidatus Eremiobacteraeota bacterium]